MTANVAESNGALVGEVSNDLGVALVDTEVVTASGLESQALGTLAVGASSQVHLAASSSNGVPSAPLLAIPLGNGDRRAAETHEEAVQSLYDLGSLYSSQAGGIPVLVAFTRHPLYPLDLGTAAERLGPSDAVVVPLLPAVGPEARTAVLGPAAGRLRESGLWRGGATEQWFIGRAAGGLVRLPVHPPRQGVGPPGTELRLRRRLGHKPRGSQWHPPRRRRPGLTPPPAGQ